MTARDVLLLSLAAGLALVVPTVAATADDRLDGRTVVARVHAYVDTYVERLSNYVAEEHTEQRIATMDPSGTPHTGIRNRWRADFAIVRSDDGRWLGLRDVFEQNGRAVAARGELTSRLFSEDRAGAGVSARRIADASAALNLGARYRNLNTPALGLELLGADRRSFVRTRAMTVRPAASAASEGPRWQVRVEERERPTLVRGIDGSPVFSTAVYDVDAATGAILAFEVIVGRKDPLRLSCRFEHHDTLDLLVPSTLEERFTDAGRSLVGVSTFSNWRRFSVETRVVP